MQQPADRHNCENKRTHNICTSCYSDCTNVSLFTSFGYKSASEQLYVDWQAHSKRQITQSCIPIWIQLLVIRYTHWHIVCVNDDKLSLKTTKCVHTARWTSAIHIPNEPHAFLYSIHAHNLVTTTSCLFARKSVLSSSFHKLWPGEPSQIYT